MTSAPFIRIGILIVPGFTALHLDLVMDGFRVANRVQGYENFRCAIVAEHSDGVTASNGRIYKPDSLLSTQVNFNIVFVIAGFQPEKSANDACLSWLRNQCRRAAIIGSVDTGTVLLVKAGLGRGKELAIHWEHEAILSAAFPDIKLSSTGAVVDGRYFTSSGGLSATTTVLSVIRKFCPTSTVGQVANILYQAGRPVQVDGSMARRDPVERAEQLMQQNLQTPLSLDEIAGGVSMHKRTLARAFERALGVTPMERYRELRLIRASNLLTHGMPMLAEVAHLTGFSSASAFSTAFKNRFGYPPSQAY